MSPRLLLEMTSWEHLPFLAENPHGELSLIDLSFYLCTGPFSIRLRVWA